MDYFNNYPTNLLIFFILKFSVCTLWLIPSGINEAK